MKNLMIFTVLAILTLSSCFNVTPKEYPAEDCSIEFSFNGVDYLETNIEEYNGLDVGSFRILVNFENGGFISMVRGNWEPAVGDVTECLFWINDGTDNYYETGTVSVDVLEDNYFSGTFVDENNFITNSSFTLRYSEF